MSARRCEARTLKGSQCKVTTNLVYHRHKNGKEYLCCRQHDNEAFRPILKPTLATPDDPIYSAGFVVGGRRIGRTRKPS